MIIPKQGDKIVVWFSCGAASAVAAKKTIEMYGDICDIHIVNNPILEEHPDNIRFLNDVSKWLNKPIELALNSKYKNHSCVEVWDDRQYMSGVGGAPCTLELKKKARYEWELKNRPDWHVLGFTLEETGRYDRFILNERNNTLPVLMQNRITKVDCFRILSEAGIELPEIYKYITNANCIGCVKATSPTYWNIIREKFPDVFEQRKSQSREIGCKLVKYKGQRMFLDELPENAKGASLKNMSSECGIFCNTK